MNFDEKMDEVERLFTLEKKFNFLNPTYGLYATGLGTLLLLIGIDDLGSVVLFTSITVSIIGMTCTFISGRYMRKGFYLFDSGFEDMKAADIENVKIMMTRYEVIKKKFL